MVSSRRLLAIVLIGSALIGGVQSAALAAGTISDVAITDNSNTGSSSGCCPSCAQARTNRSVLSQSTTSFSTRFQESVAADARLTTAISRTLNTSYTINFNVLCPAGPYQLHVGTRIKGAFTHVDDSSGCGVAGDAHSDLSAISGSQAGGSLSGSLGLMDPGGIAPTSSSQNVPFDISDSGTISATSSGVLQQHSLTFTWTGVCDSNATAGKCGAECAIRLGMEETFSPCGGTDSESADNYPGPGGRDPAADGHFVTVTLDCLCGNGVPDGSEQCDMGALNGTPGSCCTSDCQLLGAGQTCRGPANECDLAESCSGVAGDCPVDAFEPQGIPCGADTNQCTDDVCDGNGACTHPFKSAGSSCSGGVCDGAGSCGPPPTPTATATPVPLCAPTPLPACRPPVEAQKSLLSVKNKALTFDDRLSWKWSKGTATTLADFGNPLTTTSYALCVYDQTGGVPSLVVEATARAGGNCSGNDCWKALGSHGYKYQNRQLQPDGIEKIILKEGISGKAKLQVGLKGPYLTLPSPANGKVFQQSPNVVVQLVNNAAMPVCWEARFSSPAVKNTIELFRDKSD